MDELCKLKDLKIGKNEGEREGSGERRAAVGQDRQSVK